jgi:hypothetical protein
MADRWHREGDGYLLLRGGEVVGAAIRSVARPGQWYATAPCGGRGSYHPGRDAAMRAVAGRCDAKKGYFPGQGA